MQILGLGYLIMSRLLQRDTHTRTHTVKAGPTEVLRRKTFGGDRLFWEIWMGTDSSNPWQETYAFSVTNEAVSVSWQRLEK